MPRPKLPEDRPCVTCGRSSPEVKFGRRGEQSQYRQSRCRDCDNKRYKRWIAANPGRYRTEEYRARQNKKKARPESRARCRERYQARYTAVRDYKARRGCIHCGYSDPDGLQFHHRDPSTKLFNVSNINHALDKLEAEIEKCDIMCFVCHQKLHRAS